MVTSSPAKRGRGRVGRPWRTVQQQCFREETVCWLCGEWVNQDLPPGHPMARGADHLIQLQHNGRPLDRQNLHLAHGRCNTARSNSLRNLPVEQCACSHGQPCARLRPRSWLTVDATQV